MMASTYSTTFLVYVLKIIYIVLKIHGAVGEVDPYTDKSNLLCYTCLRQDGLNANVSCWTDRQTIAIDCSQQEHECINLLLNGSPDFISLRKTCQPEEAHMNPCLHYKGISYQVAGTQTYTVNGEPAKCVCLDICDAMAYNTLFGSPSEQTTSFSAHDQWTVNHSFHMEKPMLEGKFSINDLDSMRLPWDLALDSGAQPLHLTFSLASFISLAFFACFAGMHNIL
ncbi:uncharacterized protein LOC129588655 [Paramacrobiotus metropolitanus]|uniref:uncharacterized protein LOC129588655 n=1 Tax=Paramacrobiotus metropolitanus TaxID=2943436 RepID=UPI0024456C9D|nr:uncharacterized protein LOC129588655 [Paramacrobiotus metropolitanus]